MDRDVQVNHVYQKANRAADSLAILGHTFKLGVYVLSGPSQGVSELLLCDFVGVNSPKIGFVGL